MTRAWIAVCVAVAALGCDAPPPIVERDGAVGAPLGTPCTDGRACASGVCVGDRGEMGVCSVPCMSRVDCPAGSNWSCVVPAEPVGTRVCGCIADADDEVCGDGADNDCDGRTDDCRTCDGRVIVGDDDEHCGECFVACAADQTCRDGRCGCEDPGQVSCGDRCVDLDADEQHCGACGRVCSPGEECASGACSCPAATPDVCDGACVSLDADPEHCGACGRSCPDALTCRDGACVCPFAGQEPCGDTCVSTSSDPRHCGACGNACPAAQVCIAGTCACPDPALDDLCSSGCTDLASDPRNCGACGVGCDAPTTCQGGTCACSTDPTVVPCGGVCVATQSDTAHCGGCGIACGTNERCIRGTCACPSGIVCGGACIPPGDPAHCGGCGVVCGPGSICTGTSCECTTWGRTHCGPEGCFDLQNDPQHCGTCDNACAPSEICTGGACRCPTGRTSCGGACLDLGTDPDHCGACGNACRDGEVCSGGSCRCAVWTERWCDSTGGCTDVRENDLHCGACDAACPVGSTCDSGGCRCATAGLTPCATGCTDLQSDEASCGACGNVCGPTLECRAGACTCAASMPGTVQRVTTSASETWRVSAAAGVTHVGVVYRDTRLSTRGEVYFRRLNLDGTVSGDELVLASDYATVPDIAWNGSEWGVAWVDGGGTGRTVRLARIAADGTLIATVSLPALHPEGSVLGGATQGLQLVWAPTRGYVMARLTRGSTADYDLVLQVVGTDGSAPSPPVVVARAEGARLDLAVAPDGRFGLTWLGRDPSGIAALVDAARFQVVEADGSLVASRVTVATAGHNGGLIRPEWALRIAHDGVTWVLAMGRSAPVTPTSGTYEHEITLRRGPTLAATRSLGRATGSPDAPPTRQPSLAIRDGEVVVSWQQREPSPGIGYRMRTQRHRVPALANVPLEPAEPAAEVMSDPTMFGDTWESVPTPDGVVHAWGDTRWGQTEIHALAVALPACR